VSRSHDKFSTTYLINCGWRNAIFAKYGVDLYSKISMGGAIFSLNLFFASIYPPIRK